MKTAIKKSTLLFSIFMMLIFISCPKATESTVTQKPVYKVTIVENEVGNVTVDSQDINLEKVEKDTVLTFTATAKNALAYEVKNWSITGGELQEGGKRKNKTAKIKITSDVTISVSFEKIVILTYSGDKFKSTPTMDGSPINSGMRISFVAKITFVAKHANDKIIKNWKINNNKVENSEYLETFECVPVEKDVIEQNGKFVINIDFEEKIPETFSLTFDTSKLIAGTLNPMSPLSSSPAQVKEGTHLVFWALVPNGKAVKSWKANGEVLPNSQRVIYFHYISKTCTIEYEEKEAKKAKMVYDPQKIWCSFSRPNPPGATMYPVPKENTIYEGDLLSIKKNGGKKCQFAINGMSPKSDDLMPPDNDIFVIGAEYFKDDGILNLEIKE